MYERDEIEQKINGKALINWEGKDTGQIRKKTKLNGINVQN
jgi:hypothetical protein